MERFLTNIRAAKGYCLQCGLPAQVIYFKIRGWDYEFGICKECWSAFFNGGLLSNGGGKKENNKDARAE